MLAISARAYAVRQDPYSAPLQGLFRAAAREHNIALHDGVYAAMLGPSGATRPELRMLATLGVDTYGMSTVPEVIAARHCGYAHIGAVSVITDMCVWDESTDPTIEQCLAMARQAAPQLQLLFESVVQREFF